MSLWRTAPFAPVKSGYGGSGWSWTDPVTSYSSVETVAVGPFSWMGYAPYDPDSVVLKIYVNNNNPVGVIYGPEKTQDPVLYATIPMAERPSSYADVEYWCSYVPPHIATDYALAGWYIVVEVGGEPVASSGGLSWTGDESVVVDTPGHLTVPLEDAGESMTAMLAYDFEVHIEDPDAVDGWGLNAQVAWWVDWGDGNVQLAGSASGFDDFGPDGYYYLNGGIGFHTYARPGTYYIRVWCGFYGNQYYNGGFNPPTIAGLVHQTFLGGYFFTAVMPEKPVFSQPRTTYTVDIQDRSYFNPNVGSWPEAFGWDCLIGSIPFSTLRTSQVSITPKKVSPSAFTFHNPYERAYNGYRYSGGMMNSFVGVGTDLVARRDLENIEGPSFLPEHPDPDTPEATQPTWRGFDMGRYVHGNGPNPAKWRLDADAMDNIIGAYYYGPYYTHDYHFKSNRGIFSTYHYDPSLGRAQQRLGFYDMETGALSSDYWIAPDFPDTGDDPRNYDLPEAYAMYGDDEVLWMSRTGALWRTNHDTGVSRLIGNPFQTMYRNPNNHSFRDDRRPYGIGGASDGYAARITNVRNDGSITLVIYSRQEIYSATPDAYGYYDITYANDGHYQWWAYSIDRGGRLIGVPRQITHTGYLNNAPFPDDFSNVTIDFATGENNVVADPDAPIVYVAVMGRLKNLYNENPWQTAIYAIDLTTGAVRRAVWMGHPYLEWNFDATTWQWLPPETYYYGDLHDTRYLEPGWGFGATNIGPGTWKLRPPPGMKPGETLTAGDALHDVAFY